MSDAAAIEIEFDETAELYTAMWLALTAIGLGDTPMAALRDLQEALHLAVDALVESECQRVQSVQGDKRIMTRAAGVIGDSGSS